MRPERRKPSRVLQAPMASATSSTLTWFIKPELFDSGAHGLCGAEKSFPG